MTESETEVEVSEELGIPVRPGALATDVAMLMVDFARETAAPLSYEPDGDIAIRSGSAMVFVRVYETPAVIDVFSPLLKEVTTSEPLYEDLCQLTARLPVGRLYCVDATIWASVPIFGRDFQGEHLLLAVHMMRSLADTLDDKLRGKYGGRRFHDDDKADPPHPQLIGMYL